MDELLDWRKEFPILDNTVYMISHSLGAMPARTRDRLNEYADLWATRGIRAWEEGWWEMPRSVGDLVGKIIGAGEGEVVMHQNVSVCQSLIHSCLDFTGKRNKIVSEALNFPSNLYIFHALERRGARVVTVPSDDGMTVPLDRLLEAIDEETLLVSVSHVIFKSAFIQDLKAITEKAHAVAEFGWRFGGGGEGQRGRYLTEPAYLASARRAPGHVTGETVAFGRSIERVERVGAGERVEVVAEKPQSAHPQAIAHPYEPVADPGLDRAQSDLE